MSLKAENKMSVFSLIDGQNYQVTNSTLDLKEQCTIKTNHEQILKKYKKMK